MSKTKAQRLKTLFVRDELARAKEMPRLDWFVGMLTGDLLLWLGRRAARRGDIHEASHCIAALTVGATDHSGACPLPVGRPLGFDDTFTINMADYRRPVTRDA